MRAATIQGQSDRRGRGAVAQSSNTTAPDGFFDYVKAPGFVTVKTTLCVTTSLCSGGSIICSTRGTKTRSALCVRLCGHQARGGRLAVERSGTGRAAQRPVAEPNTAQSRRDVMTDLVKFLAEQAADSEVAWSLGTFGAIAEFTRDADEPVAIYRDDVSMAVVTARGGLCIASLPDLRPIASESLTKEGWSHRVALCLPRDVSAMSRRTVLAEIGPDRAALRPEDRDATLFDLGLGALQVDVCVRSHDPTVIAKLRSCTGKSVFAPDSGAMGVILAAHPHRVFATRLGRIEVFQPIPPPDGKSPSGPHTHVLPKLLAHGRTHAATEPLPDGWVPCAHLYPPNPIRDKFGRSRAFQARLHTAFQALLTGFGDPERLALKRHVISAVTAGHGPAGIEVADDRFSRATVRVALRQLQTSGPSSTALAAWLSAYDRTELDEVEDPAHH